jgi:hypothetical protein
MSIVMGATFLITLYMDESFLRLVLTTITSTLIVCLLGYYVVLPKDMQSKVVTAIKNKILNKYVDKKNNF